MNEVEELKLEIMRLNLIILELKGKAPKKRPLYNVDVLNFIESVVTVDKSSLVRKFQYSTASDLDVALKTLLSAGLISVKTEQRWGSGRTKTIYSIT